MKYMLTLIGEESDWQESSPEEMQEMLGAWGEFDQSLADAGVYLAGEALQPSATATTIRIGEAGERTVTDGPFAETKEQLGGFYLLECADLDEAIEWARKVPLQDGVVEVRPAVDLSAFGYDDPKAAVEAS